MWRGGVERGGVEGWCGGEVCGREMCGGKVCGGEVWRDGVEVRDGVEGRCVEGSCGDMVWRDCARREGVWVITHQNSPA